MAWIIVSAFVITQYDVGWTWRDVTSSEQSFQQHLEKRAQIDIRRQQEAAEAIANKHAHENGKGE